MFAHNGAKMPKNYICTLRVVHHFYQYLCNYSLITLLQHLDCKPLAVAICRCSSLGDEICINEINRWHVRSYGHSDQAASYRPIYWRIVCCLHSASVRPWHMNECIILESAMSESIKHQTYFI